MAPCLNLLQSNRLEMSNCNDGSSPEVKLLVIKIIHFYPLDIASYSAVLQPLTEKNSILAAKCGEYFSSVEDLAAKINHFSPLILV